MYSRTRMIVVAMGALSITVLSTAVALYACSCPNSKAEWVDTNYSGTSEKCGETGVTCSIAGEDWHADCEIEYGEGLYCATNLHIIDGHGTCTGQMANKKCYTNTKYQYDKQESNGCYSFLFQWHCHNLNHLQGYPKDYGDHYQTKDC